jgi:hypothetical protein
MAILSLSTLLVFVLVGLAAGLLKSMAVTSRQEARLDADEVPLPREVM